MRVDLRYLKPSALEVSGDSASLRLSPNLARPPVAFDAALRHPLRYREAMSALHEVVVGDLRRPRKDRSAWQAWKQRQQQEEDSLRAYARSVTQRELAETARATLPVELRDAFPERRRAYWKARDAFLDQTLRRDPRLYRHLVPLDPVITVAPDAVFFECFSKDGSSYGSLFVDRGAFEGAGEAVCGTTNVDYSLDLYEHLQRLRTYRNTRLLLDPSGFEVQLQGRASCKEEKIELPADWLKGFSQLQASLALPALKVELPVEALYSLLAVLARRREKVGPRALRFELKPGAPPELVLEPWDQRIPCPGAPAWQGVPATVRVWGRRRLSVLARLLPLAERVEVHLLGSGLPHIWSLSLGEMRFVLGLSGWTANNWTAGSHLDRIAGDLPPDRPSVDAIEALLRSEHKADLPRLIQAAGRGRRAALGSLFYLASRGQVVSDHSEGCYRWREALPLALADSLVGPPPPEWLAAREMIAHQQVLITRRERLPGGQLLLMGAARAVSCELLLDGDDAFQRAACTCNHFHRFGLKAGPCRHLLALQLSGGDPPLPDWS